KIETQDLGFQIETYALLKTLYEKLNNKYSFDLYDKKLKNLMKKEKKIKLDDKTNDEKHVSQEKLETPIDKAYINTLKLTHQLLDLIAYSHQIAETNSFREFLRTFFMRVSDEVSVKNFIVFTKKDEMLYHYIKERLYDKPLIVQTYQETLIG